MALGDRSRGPLRHGQERGWGLNVAARLPFAFATSVAVDLILSATAATRS